MAGEEVKVNWSGVEQALTRRIATSSRDIGELSAEMFRGIIKTVVRVTPPMHDQGPGDGLTNFNEGREAGRNKIASNIRALYGTPTEAFDLLEEKAGKRAARNFWALYKHGKTSPASDVLRPYASGAGFYPFDAGTVHKRFRRRGGAVGRSRKVFFVSDPRELDAYIKMRQGNVFFLASGWKPICAALGVALPQMVTQHDAPGVATLTVTDDEIRLFAANDVSYNQAVDLQRRVQWAVDSQEGKMARMWSDYMKNRYWQNAGFKMAA